MRKEVREQYVEALPCRNWFVTDSLKSKGERPTLVFIHGRFGTNENWRPQVRTSG